jgi:hypothetical protein
MHQQQEPARESYPHGRGYGHDYMRGGEVLEGYGYSSRPEYARRRGDADEATDAQADSGSEVVTS